MGCVLCTLSIVIYRHRGVFFNAHVEDYFQWFRMNASVPSILNRLCVKCRRLGYLKEGISCFFKVVFFAGVFYTLFYIWETGWRGILNNKWMLFSNWKQVCSHLRWTNSFFFGVFRLNVIIRKSLYH